MKKIEKEKCDYSKLIKYYKRKLVDYGVMREIQGCTTKGQYKKMKKCKYDLIKLHKVLSTPNSLQKLYSNFKSRVLDFSMNEINNNTELKVEYEENKIGKSVNSLDFRIPKVDKSKVELVGNDFKEVKHNKGVSFVDNWVAGS